MLTKLGALPGTVQSGQTVRRKGAEAGVSLRKWRAWFDEAGEPPADETPGEDGGGETQQPQDITGLPQWAQDVIKGLRDEAAKNRVKAKQAEEQRAKEEAERLAQQGEWQKLAEQRAAELDALKPVSDKAAALEAKIKATNEARIKTLPEAYRGMVPEYDDPVKVSEWLDRNMAALQARSAPNLDGGAQGDAAKNVKLTAEELAAAKRMGLTPEKYAEFKNK